jgi:hypothetical protein
MGKQSIVASIILAVFVSAAVGLGVYAAYWQSYDSYNPAPPTAPLPFVLESKVKINVPELEDCTLYTLTNETIAWPLRIVRCADLATINENNDNISINRP